MREIADSECSGNEKDGRSAQAQGILSNYLILHYNARLRHADAIIRLFW